MLKGHLFQEKELATYSQDTTVLTLLSEHESEWVRKHVAMNPHTPKEVRDKLTKDPDPYVRWYCYKGNPSYTADELKLPWDLKAYQRVISKESSETITQKDLQIADPLFIIAEIEKNRISFNEIEYILEYDEVWYKQELARNCTNLRERDIKELCKEDTCVIAALVQNPSVPLYPWLLEFLWQYPGEYIQYLVVKRLFY